MEEITSASNSRIRRLVLLRQKAKERRQSQSFVIEGERLVLDAPADFLQEIYVTQEIWEKNRKKLEPLGGRVILLSREAMEKASDTKTPQGILAVAGMPQYTLADLFPDPSEKKPPLLLILEDIQDPGNLGTMFRTAEAAGADGIIMSPNTVDVFNPKTVRSTMSSIFRLPFVTAENFQGTLRWLQEEGICLMAACLDGSRSYAEVSCRRPCAFLIGNEGNGLSGETIRMADERIHIPMEGQIESLNAAMSAGILMYEAHRQRHSLAVDTASSCLK